jgi:pyruvate,water dikinase
MQRVFLDSDPPVCWLDGHMLDVESVGGKGASLGRLRALGAPVPLAAAVPARVYRDVAAGIGVPSILTGVPLSELESIRGRILDVPLPPYLADALCLAGDVFREEAGPAGVSLAVRSSAPVEDSARYAFAGLHDTILDVQPGEALERAIRECWASLWSDRAIAYRHEHNLDHLPMDIAVVVQQLVRCDVSFVAFAIDPISGNDDCVLITSTWGLGEAVVAGLVVPDQIRVERSGIVREYQVGSKAVMVISGPEGARTVPVPRILQSQPTLTPDVAATIAEMVRSLSGALGFPADVEGGLVGDQLYLFQARPITSALSSSSTSTLAVHHEETLIHDHRNRYKPA